MSFSKVDIDALVDGLIERGWCGEDILRRDAYLAAGLTATGEQKPKRVRGWLVPRYYSDGRPLFTVDPPGAPVFRKQAIPGTFVPDEEAP